MFCSTWMTLLFMRKHDDEALQHLKLVFATAFEHGMEINYNAFAAGSPPAQDRFINLTLEGCAQAVSVLRNVLL